MATLDPKNVKKAFEGAAENLPPEMKQSALEAAQIAQEWAADGVEKARDFVRENPVVTVAAGFGLGLLVGAWLRRE